MRGKKKKDWGEVWSTECWLRAVMTADGMPTPIILSVIADRSSWPLNSPCSKKGGGDAGGGGWRRGSRKWTKLPGLLALVSVVLVLFTCKTCQLLNWPPTPAPEVKGQGFWSCDSEGDVSPKSPQLFQGLFFFFFIFLISCSLSTPVEKGSTRHSGIWQQPRCRHTAICISACGSAKFWRCSPVPVKKVCHRFFPPPCHRPYLISLCCCCRRHFNSVRTHSTGRLMQTLGGLL